MLVALLAVVGCAPRGLTRTIAEAFPVAAPLVVTTLQTVDEKQVGPAYQVSLTVPQEWVGKFEVVNRGNSLTFTYIVSDRQRAPIFFVDALTETQYWEQIGSYPGQYTNLEATPNAYFTYHLPVDAYYSGLPSEEYAAFAKVVPDIVKSFSAAALAPVQ
jgi:hypothetical protein